MAEGKEGSDCVNVFILMRKLFQCIIAVLLTWISSSAQLHWKKVDSVYGPLPNTFHVYYTNDSLDGAPFIAYYASVKLSDKELSFTARADNDKRYTPRQFFQRERSPLLVVNCTFFSFESGRNLNVVVRDGKMIAFNVGSLKGIGKDSAFYYYPTRSAIGINRKRKADVAWIFTDSSRRWPYAFEKAPVIAKGQEQFPGILDLTDIEWRWWRMRTAVGGGPTLVHDGEILITNKEEQMFVGEENNKEPRTVMGFTRDDRLIILVIQGRFPGIAEGAGLNQEAKIAKEIGCLEALNLNGGGSSCMLINGKETIQPSDQNRERPIPAVFMIKKVEKKK
jgi:hypothetical protein